MDRRNFIKTLGIAGGTIAGTTQLQADESTDKKELFGVLVDTTKCLGCRTCEAKCAEIHNLPIPDVHDTSIWDNHRTTTAEQLTIVNRYESEKGEIFAKRQCMHCNHPSCVSACIVGALSKEENGSVVWDTDKCIGCRYCMVACPFQIPSFEFGEAFRPNIIKCDFCFSRTQNGRLPACVDICPVEALTYGPRTELIKVAKERIRRAPEKYVHYVYGEFEAGGTSWMYLANTDFASMGFPNVGTHPMPGTSESIQHGIFAYFIPPVLLYAMLGGVMWVTRHRKETEHEELK